MPNDELRVFISWSGETSKSIAIALRDLLPVIFDNVRPWVSDRDIGAGGRGLQKIASELEDTAFGIIVVTRDNQESAWINFEAGALSKRFGSDESRVVPLLVDMDAIAELEGPLTQFQAKLLDRPGVEDLLAAIGDSLGVSEDVIKRRLATEWEPFMEKVAAARSEATQASKQPKRSVESMVEETLELVRNFVSEPSRPKSTTPKSATTALNDLAVYFDEAKIFGAKATVAHDRLTISVDDPFIGDTDKISLGARFWKFLRSRGYEPHFTLLVNGEEVPPF